MFVSLQFYHSSVLNKSPAANVLLYKPVRFSNEYWVVSVRHSLCVITCIHYVHHVHPLSDNVVRKKQNGSGVMQDIQLELYWFCQQVYILFRVYNLNLCYPVIGGGGGVYCNQLYGLYFLGQFGGSASCPRTTLSCRWEDWDWTADLLLGGWPLYPQPQPPMSVCHSNNLGSSTAFEFKLDRLVWGWGKDLCLWFFIFLNQSKFKV